MSAKWSRESGQSFVEFALVGLLYFTLIFGIMEMGWLLFNYHEVTNAAREGARYAIVHGTMSAGITDPSQAGYYTLNAANLRAAILAKTSLPDPNALTVTVTEPDGDLQPGHRVTIAVSYPYQPLIGFILNGMSITLHGTSTMIVYY